MKTLTLLMAGAAAAFVAGPCLAQPVSLCGFASEQSISTENAIGGDAPDATVGRLRAVKVEGGIDDGSATISLGGTFKPDIACGLTDRKVTTGAWSVALSIPAAEEGDSVFGDLDGLARSKALAFSYRRTTVRSNRTVDPGKMEAFCDQARAAYEARKDAEPKLANNKGCSEGLIEQWDPATLPGYREAVWGKSPAATTWGLTAKVGTDDFEYVDTATLDKSTDDETSWSMKVFYAYKPLHKATLWTASLEHQSAWKGQDEEIYCPAGGGVLTCIKAAGGPPKGEDSDILAFEYRSQRKGVAFALKASHDFTGDVSGIDLPIYFVPQADDGLIGGLRLGWRSDEGGVTAVIFIGKPFSLD